MLKTSDDPQANAGDLQPTINFPADYESSVSINRFGETIIGAVTQANDKSSGLSPDSAPQKLGKRSARPIKVENVLEKP